MWHRQQLIADRLGTKRAPSTAARDDGSRAIGTPAKRSRLERFDRRTLESAFVQNEVAFACVNQRADSASDCSLIVQARQSDGSYAPMPNHPLRRLLVRPNDRMGEADLIRAAIASMDVAGCFYAERLMSPAGALAGLNPLNPASVTPMDLGAGLVYRWQESGQRHVDFRPDELLIRRGDWTRPSRMAVALSTIDGDNALTDHVRAFMNNGAVPPGRIKVKGTLTTDQADGIRARWIANFGRGRGSQQAPAVFDDNGDYEKIGSNLDELESAIVRGVAESRICMTFQVPPIVIMSYFGLSRSTYSNMDAAMRWFWQTTMSQLLKEWRSWLTWSLLSEFENQEAILSEQVRLFWDTSLVSALQADADKLSARITQGYSAGLLTLNEGRSALGLERDPAGDVYKTASAPAAPNVVQGDANLGKSNGHIKSNGHTKELIDAN